MSRQQRASRPRGGFTTQSGLVTGRSVARFNYAIRQPENISPSSMPEWQESQVWVLASPTIGYHTTFAEYLVHIYPGGGCQDPEPESNVESFLYVLEGALSLAADGKDHQLTPGGYMFLPAGTVWSVSNPVNGITKFLWVRKGYQPWKGLRPQLLIGEVSPLKSQPATEDNYWQIERLLPADDLSFDMIMNVVTFLPGGIHALFETHPEEHGLYMLEGQGLYFLGEEWHEVIEGDFIWMRPYCPQSYYAGGVKPTRYLLYKNANRPVYLSSSRTHGGV